MSFPQGIVLTGRYAGKQQVTNKAGEPVKNMFEVGVTVSTDDGDTLYRASYF